MTPDEGPRRVAFLSDPRGQALDRAASLPVAVAHLPIHQANCWGERGADADGGAVRPGGGRHRGNVVGDAGLGKVG
jgi:hypothetical protein